MSRSRASTSIAGMVSHPKEKRHFCFLNLPIEFYSPATGGAIATIIGEMARELDQSGHRVTVLTRMDGNPVHPHGEVLPLGPCGREDLTFVRRRLSGLLWRFNRWDWPYFDYYRKAVGRAVRKMGDAPTDVVVFNDLLSPVFLKKMLPGAAIYVWLHNELRTREPDLSKSIACTERWFTCSEYIRQWTLKHHPFEAERVFAILNGVNLEQFYPRDGFDAITSEVRVLFVGRIDPNKGPDIAVDAVAALREEGWPVSMTVAGGTWFYQRDRDEADPYLQSLRTKMQAAGVHHLGHVPRDQIASVFRAHDVVCVLSRSSEPFGLVVLEAMASGCAVVASNRGGLPEASGGAAVLVDPDDPDAVRGALRRFLADPAALATAKRRGVQRAGAATWRAAMELLLEVTAARTGPF